MNGPTVMLSRPPSLVRGLWLSLQVRRRRCLGAVQLTAISESTTHFYFPSFRDRRRDALAPSLPRSVARSLRLRRVCVSSGRGHGRGRGARRATLVTKAASLVRRGRDGARACACVGAYNTCGIAAYRGSDDGLLRLHVHCGGVVWSVDTAGGERRGEGREGSCCHHALFAPSFPPCFLQLLCLAT